jgi:hypothetical protein
MLTFLRKIRRSLINSGSARRYFLYAIGEIALVVIGILIALQINNWNETRKRNENLRIYLTNILADIEDDQATLVIIKNGSSFAHHSMTYLLKLAGAFDSNEFLQELPSYEGSPIWNNDIPENYDREFIELTFLWSIRVSTPVSNRSAINEMKNTGMYAHLYNQELKNALTDYHWNWDWRLGSSVMDDLREEWEKSLESEGIITSNISGIEDPIELIKNKPIRIAKIKRLIRESRFWAHSADLLEKEVDDLKQMIEKEILKM